MDNMVTLCGDNCKFCPRRTAKTEEELKRTAEIWFKVGWSKKLLSNDEIKCYGCKSHKSCTFGVVACIKEHGVEKCSKCSEFPCEKIDSMLEKSRKSEEICKKVLTCDEYEQIEKAFFHKEENL